MDRTPAGAEPPGKRSHRHQADLGGLHQDRSRAILAWARRYTGRRTGVATSAGVESTARQAHELGFNVALAVDAMTDMDPAAHDNSVTRIFPKMSETGTTSELLNLINAQTRT
ncbi:isochorismatase family protein [Bradyrhizobium sp. Tv2a-2]|uniref:isochorismatase family protein n=1 Tax=Bradyrhizobium sp. Tv2a-2 TaxID=113395 RepID=UPI0032DE669D